MFLSLFIEKEEKKDSVKNENDVRKRLVWNKLLTTNNAFMESDSVTRTNSWYTLSMFPKHMILACHRSMERKDVNTTFNDGTL